MRDLFVEYFLSEINRNCAGGLNNLFKLMTERKMITLDIILGFKKKSVQDLMNQNHS